MAARPAERARGGTAPTTGRTSPPLVADPAVRAVLLTTRRALLMICAAIAKHCGVEAGDVDT